MPNRNNQHTRAATRIYKESKASELEIKINANYVNDLAKKNGFDSWGVVNSKDFKSYSKELNSFIYNQHHGDMSWLENRSAMRSDPRILWPDVRSIIIFGSNYHYNCNSLDLLKNKEKGIFSVYARNHDYHSVLKKKLKNISSHLINEFKCNLKYFVDTAPVMEKPLAMTGGIGWQGKHTNLVSKEYGSWLFLSSIFLDIEIKETEPESNHCGTCSKCIDICPTEAIIEPYKLDARKCISYLTIEHKGHIDLTYRSLIGNRIYGCDDCLAVCPWNKFAKISNEINFKPRDDLIDPELNELIELTNESFKEKFRGTSIRRIGRDRFIRNVLIAIGNSKNASFKDKILHLIDDKADIVRAMAIWALKQIIKQKDFNKYKDYHLKNETDYEVLQEWLN